MMRKPLYATAIAIVGVVASTLVAHAQSRHELSFNEPLPQLLLKAESPAQLRDELEAYAEKVRAEDPQEASRALGYKARSLYRAGEDDAALATYLRALADYPDHAYRLAAIDILLRRRGDGDVARALALIEESSEGRGAAPGLLHVEYEARRAWAHTLDGFPDRGVAGFIPLQRRLLEDLTWRYRIGKTQMLDGQHRAAFETLLPLAVESRGTDSEVIDLMNQIGDRLGMIRTLDQEVRRVITEDVRKSLEPIKALGAVNLRFFGRDSFPLGGVLAKPSTAGPHRAAVIMVGPTSTVSDYDSLTVLLREQGFAVLMMDVRGSGESVAAECPLPDTWTGREDVLAERTAHDVKQAFDRLVQDARVETSRYLLVADRGAAPIAVRAARLDERVRALVLVSPRPEDVERGPMRAGLAALKLPVYFQVGPEDYLIKPVIEELYQACDRGASWVSDGRSAGSGPGQFKRDPRVVKQLKRWVDDALPQTSGQNEARPSTPRKG